jgi:ferric-dicitrate binding protein FerR (iron transport regulator)
MTRWRRTTACERAAQWISLDLDGELGRLEQAALVRHLRRCDRCRTSSSEIESFTTLLREAPPIDPARAIVVPTPAWARRRARATIRGGVLALVAAVAGLLAVAVLPHSESAPPGSLGFSGTAQQQQFARDHAVSEPTLFVVAENALPPSLTPRPLL